MAHNLTDRATAHVEVPLLEKFHIAPSDLHDTFSLQFRQENEWAIS